MLKPTAMQQKYLIRLALIAVLVVSSFLILRSSTNSVNKKEICIESMEDCSKNKKKESSNEMIWETLSRQFFTSTGNSY